MDLRQGKVVVSHGSKQAHSQSKGSRDDITINCAAGAAFATNDYFRKIISIFCMLPKDPSMPFMQSPHTQTISFSL